MAMMAVNTLVVSLVVIVCCALVDHAQAHPNGAGNGACSTLVPPHGTAQTSATPYTISVGSVTQYKSGTNVAVRVSGPAFAGILIQARKKSGDNTPVGTFVVPPANTNTKVKQCTNAADSFTHSNTNAKNNITVYWMPPSGDMGTIIFKATIAQAKTTWWANHMSDELASGNTNSAIGVALSHIMLLMCIISSSLLLL